MIAEKTDELIGFGGLGLNIIPLVVCVIARKGLAARDRGIGSEGEELLDTVDIIWVDDSGDIEVGHSSPGVEADFTEHTASIFGSLRDSEPVTYPAGWEGLIGIAETLDGEGFDTIET